MKSSVVLDVKRERGSSQLDCHSQVLEGGYAVTSAIQLKADLPQAPP